MKTTQLVQKNPDRFLGLCGYNISWPDAESYLKRCLSKQGMVGVKIHSENTKSRLQNLSVLKKFQDLFASIENSFPVVLWYFNTRIDFSQSNYVDLASDLNDLAANAWRKFGFFLKKVR